MKWERYTYFVPDASRKWRIYHCYALLTHQDTLLVRNEIPNRKWYYSGSQDVGDTAKGQSFHFF